MIKPFRRKKKNKLDEEIEDILKEMSYQSRYSDEYAKSMDYLERLTKLKEEKDSKRRVSSDTLIMAATNLIGILLILHYEKIDVVASRALGFVSKGRV